MAAETTTVLFGDTFFHAGVAPRLDSIRFRVPVSISSFEVLSVVPEGAAVDLFCRVKGAPRFAPVSSADGAPAETDYVAVRGTYARLSLLLRGTAAANAAEASPQVAPTVQPQQIPAVPPQQPIPPPIPRAKPRVPRYRSDDDCAVRGRRPPQQCRVPPSVSDLAQSAGSRAAPDDRFVALLRRAAEGVRRLLPSGGRLAAGDVDLARAGRLAAEVLDARGPLAAAADTCVAALDAAERIALVSASFAAGFVDAEGVEHVAGLLWSDASDRSSLLRLRALDTLLALVDQSPVCADRFCDCDHVDGGGGKGYETAYQAVVSFLLESHTDSEVEAARAVITRANGHAAVKRLKAALDAVASDPAMVAAKARPVIGAMRDFRSRVEQLDVPHGCRSVVPSLAAIGFVPLLRALVDSSAALQEQQQQQQQSSHPLQRTDGSSVIVLPELSLILFELLMCSDGLRYLLENADDVNGLLQTLDPEKSSSVSTDDLGPLSLCMYNGGVVSKVNLARVLSAHLHASELAFQLHESGTAQKHRIFEDLLRLSHEDAIAEEAVLWAVTRYSAFLQLADEVSQPVTGDREDVISSAMALLRFAVSWQSFMPLIGIIPLVRRVFKASSRIASGEQGKHLPPAVHDDAKDIAEWSRLSSLWSEKGHECIDELLRTLSLDVAVSANVPSIATALVFLNALTAHNGPHEDAGAVFSRTTVDSVASLLSGIAKLFSSFPDGDPADAVLTQCDDVNTLMPIATLCLDLCRSLLCALRRVEVADFVSTPLLAAVLDVYCAACGLPMCPCMTGTDKPRTRFGYFICKLQDATHALLAEWMAVSEPSRKAIPTSVFDLLATAPKFLVPCFKLLVALSPAHSELLRRVWADIFSELPLKKKLDDAILDYAGTNCCQLFEAIGELLAKLIEFDPTQMGDVVGGIFKLVSESLDTAQQDEHLFTRLFALLVVAARDGSSLFEPSESSALVSRALVASSSNTSRARMLSFALAHRLTARLTEANELGKVAAALWQLVIDDKVERECVAAALFCLLAFSRGSDEGRKCVVEAFDVFSPTPFASLAGSLKGSDAIKQVACLALELADSGIPCDDETRKELESATGGESLQAQISPRILPTALLAEEDFERTSDVEAAQGLFTQPPLCIKRRRHGTRRSMRSKRVRDDRDGGSEEDEEDAKKDVFRSRKPNTSRAASIHVDQFTTGQQQQQQAAAPSAPLTVQIPPPQPLLQPQMPFFPPMMPAMPAMVPMSPAALQQFQQMLLANPQLQAQIMAQFQQQQRR